MRVLVEGRGIWRGAPGVEVLPPAVRGRGRGDNPEARRGFFFFFGYRGVSKSAYGGRGNPNLLEQKVREAPICVHLMTWRPRTPEPKHIHTIRRRHELDIVAPRVSFQRDGLAEAPRHVASSESPRPLGRREGDRQGRLDHRGCPRHLERQRACACKAWRGDHQRHRGVGEEGRKEG